MAKALPIASVDALLGAKDLTEKTVDIPEWGVSVRVRGLSRGEAREMTDEKDATKAEALALATAIVEPTVTLDQATRLVSEKSFQATERLLTSILELSGLTAGFRT